MCSDSNFAKISFALASLRSTSAVILIDLFLSVLVMVE